MSMIQWIQGSPFQELWSPILYQGVFFIVIREFMDLSKKGRI